MPATTPELLTAYAWQSPTGAARAVIVYRAVTFASAAAAAAAVAAAAGDVASARMRSAAAAASIEMARVRVFMARPRMESGTGERRFVGKSLLPGTRRAKSGAGFLCYPLYDPEIADAPS